MYIYSIRIENDTFNIFFCMLEPVNIKLFNEIQMCYNNYMSNMLKSYII